MKRIMFDKLPGGTPRFNALLALAALGVLGGLGAAWYMEHHGHIVTGMNNQIVWGTPHVFAVFLIVAASGALNIASFSSVFNRAAYKPLARLSGLLAISLLVGGLAVLVLDLGRPERLIIAMTKYNFKSIFAWNIYLYVGFLAVVAAYLWTMMQRRMSRYTRLAGTLAFVWRLILTTGTGSIFGFLVAREAYDAALLAPLFIAASFAFGLAITILVLLIIGSELTGTLMPRELAGKFRGLMIIFILAVVYFTTLHLLTSAYGTEHHGIVRFMLLEGGVYTKVFWLVQIGIGTLLPLALLARPATGATRGGLAIASIAVIIGGLAQMYVLIIGGQAYPLVLFPGMEVSSSFQDGQIAHYAPSLPEVLLGVGGVSIALLIIGIAVKVLAFLPQATLEEPEAAAGEAT